MKFKLRAKDPAGDVANNKASSPVAGKVGKSIKKSAFAAFGTAALLLLVVGFLFDFLGAQRISGSRSQATQVIANAIASQLATVIAEKNQSLDSVAQYIASLTVQDNHPIVWDRRDELGHFFPKATRILQLGLGVEEVDPNADARLSYANLEMIRAATKPGKIPKVEIHRIGTPEQHINFVRSIRKTNTEVPLGYLMVGFPVNLIEELVKAVSLPTGYLAVQQKAAGKFTDVVTLGAQKNRSGDVTIRAPIEGTEWVIAYWSGYESGVFFDSGMIGAAILLVSILLLGGLFFLLFWPISNALRSDFVSIMSLVKDMVAGQIRRSYPVVLVESQGVMETLDRLARTAVKSERSIKSTAKASSDEMGGVVSALNVADALNVDLVDPDEKIQLQAEIFKAYDIRGIVGSGLTEEVVRELGRAIGSEAYDRGQQSIIVARDGRLSGPDLMDALINGLCDSGRDVQQIGLVPTPVLYFATHYLGAGSGVMVTGSHNPSNYNGLKIMLGGETLAGDAIQALRRRIEIGNLLDGEGEVETVEVIEGYIERITNDVHLARPLKVVIDCGNGAAGEVAPKLIRALGCEVIELYCDIDGNFPNHHPDPSKAENLQDLIRSVAEHGADIGFAFDGDGDRLGVVASDGRIIWPDRVLMLLAMDVIARHPGADVIYDVKCSRHLARVISEYGGNPIMWNTGHSLIKAKMKETNALIAGEMSGHIFFKERWFGFDDGIYAAARLLEVLCADHRDSAGIFASLPDGFNTPELSVMFEQEGAQFQFMQAFLAQAKFGGAKVTTIDGLRADFEDGWGLVRASNTTPSLVMRFEGDSPETLQRIQEDFRTAILEVDPKIILPF